MKDVAAVELVRGNGPIVLGLPHTGTHLPEDIFARLNPLGRALADTDWHIHRLYDGLLAGVTTVRATHHRYMLDVNRDPSGTSLYPGQNTTGLVPLSDFEGRGIWDDPPGDADIAARLEALHRPYHAAMEAEMARVHALHGVAIHYDCHSIRSHIPFLFDGRLPDFNIGDNNATTCDPRVTAAVAGVCAQARGYSTVCNGRFRGGWTTRHYGRPEQGWHAVQMELAQSTYLSTEAPPWSYDTAKADDLRTHLGAILHALAELAGVLKHTA